jgi:nanoRNase/pAp phosphatase (c-di-AMP/oligoRNAs hydrolase)
LRRRSDLAASLQDKKTNNIMSISNVLETISNDKSYSVFEMVSNANSNGEIIQSKLALTRKQYYSKMSAIMKAGLIKRQSGRYYLTSFGKVIYCCTAIAKKALDNYYNLKAIEVTEANNFSDEEIGNLIDTLIDNQQVKEFLAKKC